jgi:hypothetical protein
VSKPFDATLNDLISIRPDDWARYFARVTGIPPGLCESLDTDLATTLQADRIFRINGVSPVLLHLELEANPRLGVPRDLMRYNTLIDHQHNLPVESVLVLLRPKALASDQNGLYVRYGVTGSIIAQFRYRVERVWEHSVDDWLRSGLGVAPLALLTDEADANLEKALERFKTCLLDHKADEAVTKSVLGSSYVLCGLRYEQARIAEMYRRLSMLMEESTTYQEILGKGVAQGLERGQLQAHRNLLLRQGTKRLGEPAPATTAALGEITDLKRLERLAERILDATSWDDLLKGE